MQILISGLLAASVLCVATIIALTVTPACVVSFSDHLFIGYCESDDNRISEKFTTTDENKLLKNKINQLEKELLSINCPSVQASVDPLLNEPQNINVQEWEDKNISALKKCWELVGNQLKFQDVASGKISTVHTWGLCFDEVGKGKQTLLSDSMTCKGNVSAKFRKNGSLDIIDAKDIECDNNYTIFRREINCVLDSSGKANCKSFQPESPGTGTGRSIFELVRTSDQK